MSAVSALGTPGSSRPVSRVNKSRSRAPTERATAPLALLASAGVTVHLLFVPVGSARGGEGGTADHVIGHHSEDVVQTVADMQRSGLRSGGLIAVMDGGTDGQMLHDGLLHPRGPAFSDLAQSLQMCAKPV